MEIRTVIIPSIPYGAARDEFLDGLRWKTSRLSGRRLTASSVEKYFYWLQRFERWLSANDLPLDLGALTENDFRHLQSDILDEIDEGSLKESSAATYVRAVKSLFREVWERLELEPAADPTRKLRAGSQQAVDFPLFKEEHVRALLRAAVRPRPGHIAAWMPYRDHALLACFFDLGWRVGEASKAQVEDVDLRGGFVTIPRENAKLRHKGRVVGLNHETGRVLKAWMDKWRPAVRHTYLFVNEDGDQLPPNGIRKLFRRLAAAGGIPTEAARVSPHTCRHYFAVQWARNHPGDLAGLQRVMGHSSVRTTQIYFERAEDLGAVERQQLMPSNWR